MFKSNTIRWLLLGLLVLALILTPFFMFGYAIEAWTQDFVQVASQQPVWVALVLGALLAGDILIPTPSSLVNTAAGFVLGFVGGALTSLVGMTISCLIGFWLGARFGRPITQRMVGQNELEKLEALSQRFGDWVIIVARPVPVLAEASILVAGTSHMPLPRFVIMCVLSNLGISAVYAAVGAFSANVNSFLLAFGAAVLLPGLAMLAMRKQGSGNAQHAEETQSYPEEA